MKRGLVTDSFDHGGESYAVPFWIEGAAERRKFWGTVKTEGKKKFYIASFRCEHCGFLKFYADADQPFEK